jgi:phage-related protein|tara:strand:+ start:514 stop:1500 length:987 start_codon:yes stop_codon:yes gene_type:complete
MGFLSKIFKPFKNIVKKVAKTIKGVSKILWKPIKAVLKPIAKVFNKLGPIGTIALAFILPGIGGVVGTWFEGMGAAFQGLFKGMPKLFNAIGHVGTAIKNAASWVGNTYESTIGKVFDSIGGAIKTGINNLTGGAADRFGEWMGTFADKISYKGPGIIDPSSTIINDAAATATKTLEQTMNELKKAGFAGGEEKRFPKLSDAWDKATGKVTDVYEGIVKPIQKGQAIKEFIDPSDPARQRLSGPSYGMIDPFGTSWSGNFATIDFSNFNLQDSIQQNVKGLADLFASGFGATIPYGMDPSRFIQSMPGYGMQPEDMYSRVFGNKEGGD